MDKSLVGHSVLAVAAVGLAYWAWSAPRAESDAGVVLVQGSPERLTGIAWHEQDWNVTLGRDGDRFNITLERTASTKPNATRPQPATTWPTSSQVTELVKKLSPLRAARALGKPTAEQLKSLGLDVPSASLTLRYGERGERLDLGGNTFGTGDTYARKADGTAYVVSSGTLASLRHGAASLVDRNAAAVAREQIERVVVRAGERSREVVQRHADERDKAFFADPAEPDQKLATTGVWLDRVLHLRAVDLVPDEPKGSPAFELELFGTSGVLGALKLWAPEAETAIVASTRFKQPFTVSKASAEGVLRDLDAVLKEGRE